MKERGEGRVEVKERGGWEGIREGERGRGGLK